MVLHLRHAPLKMHEENVHGWCLKNACTCMGGQRLCPILCMGGEDRSSWVMWQVRHLRMDCFQLCQGLCKPSKFQRGRAHYASCSVCSYQCTCAYVIHFQGGSV